MQWRGGCVPCVKLRGGCVACVALCCVAVAFRGGCVSLCLGRCASSQAVLFRFGWLFPAAPGLSVLVPCSAEHKMVLRQISCCQVTQVWKILIQRSRSEARPYILLLIHFILLFRPSISPLLIEYFMAFLMGEMSRWTLFTKLTTSP